MREKEPRREIDEEFWQGIEKKKEAAGEDPALKKRRIKHYELVKKELEDFREEQGIEKTAEELAAEDADLRKKFNID